MWVVMRTNGNPATLAAPARRVIRDLDPALPIYSLSPLSTIASESIASQRFSMLLLALFAGTALFLSAVGLYGEDAYSVTQRTREIGLRVAIGAGPGDVLRLVVGGGLKLAVVGVVIGLAGALALSSLVKSLLFDVVPSDPASYALTAGILLVVALLACYLPARRATRVDPMIALQAE
jgi:putative ABC transport system permease protein